MDAFEEITLYDLLQQRELAFVKVHDYEKRIDHILGQPFQFPNAPQLPSTAWKKARRVRKTKAKRITARRLRATFEDAYLVEFLYKGELGTEILRDYSLIQLLIKKPLPNVELLKISTVSFDNDGHQEIVHVLVDITPADADV